MFLPALARSRFRTKLKAEARCELLLESQRAGSVLDDLAVPVPTRQVPHERDRFGHRIDYPRRPCSPTTQYDPKRPRWIVGIDMFTCEMSRTATC